MKSLADESNEIDKPVSENEFCELKLTVYLMAHTKTIE